MPRRALNTISLLFAAVLVLWGTHYASADPKPQKSPLLENVRFSLSNTREPGVKKYVLEADIHGTRNQVCSVVCNYYRYNTFMPKEVRSKVIRQVGKQFVLQVVVNLPWPFRDLESILLVEVNKDKGTAHWKRIGGNVKKNEGRFEIEERGDISHLKQVTYLDIGRYYPDWFIRIYTRTLTYRIMRAIRDEMAVQLSLSTS